jgi:hypothetical protein
MKWAHLIFGFVVFVIFTVTGRYMRADFPDKDAMPQELRVLMRSRHIYILFSAFIHLGLGVYLQLRPQLWRRAVQIGGSAVLFASSILLIWAFVVETYELRQFSDLSRNGIYASLWGIGLHIIGGVTGRSGTK